LEESLQPSFRAKQVYNWIYKKYTTSYSDMKNISANTKEELAINFPINLLTIIKEEKSNDGSIKYLFEFKDGATAEAVLLLMKEKQKDANENITRSEKYTFCISTQIGCKIGCSFCLTGKGGFTRDLTAGEIVAQVVYLKKENLIPAHKSVNIVYMGMGEPLDNYDNLVQAIKIIDCKEGLSINAKRQTVSTSGISHKIEQLGKEDLGVQLAISLHAVDDDLRSELIPINKAYNIQSVISAVKKYPVNTRKKIMFEYLVIRNKNDDMKSADNLIKILNGINAKVNLIYFNPYGNIPYQRPSRNSMLKFQNYLNKKGLFCTIRESKGLDISAACGQLKEKESSV